MTVHIVPVGVSVLKALRDRGHKAAPTGLDPRTVRVGQYLDGLESEFTSHKKTAPGWLLDDPEGGQILQRFAQVAQLSNWSSQISAEVQSLGEDNYSRDTDMVLLLATDTVEGLLAAAVTAERLARGRAGFLPGPDHLDQSTLGGAGAVRVVRIPRMDLSHCKDFTESMRQLGRFGRALHLALPADGGRAAAEPELHFHLSGGYKAAIPFFLALAEGMRSLRKGSKTVTAWCLHETTTGKEKLVPIPLRFFLELGPIRKELEALTKGRRLPVPGQALLEGYAYEKGGDGYVLTAFGEGLLELLTPDGAPPNDVMQR